MKPPKITSHPNDIRDVLPGKQVPLEVTASGHDIRYQWEKNRIAIPGATSRKFNIFDVMLDNEGDYQCVVNNNAGNSLSNSAKLTLCKLVKQTE